METEPTGVTLLVLQLAPLFLCYLIFLVPLWVMLRRTGKSLWWLILAIVPILGGLIVFWLIAFSRWPKFSGTR